MTGTDSPTRRLRRGQAGGEISGSVMFRQTKLLHHIGGASQTILNDWQELDLPKYVSGNPFHFLSTSENATLALSVSISIITGGILAVLSYYAGAIADPLTLPSRRHLFTPYITIMGLLMFAAFVGFAASAYLQETLAEKQICRIRKHYMQHLLRQDTGWYDLHSDENLSSFLSENLRYIKSGTGLKFLRLMNCLGTILVATVMGFMKLWSLTLVSFLVAFPLMITLTAIFLKRHAKHTRSCTDKSVLAIATAEENMVNIRTITAFSLQDRMYRKFVDVLVATYEEGIKAALHIGLGEMSKGMVIGATYLGAFALIGYLMLRDIRRYGEEVCAAENSPCLSGGAALGTFYLATTPCFVVLNANTSLNALSPAISSIKTITERLKSVTKLDSTDVSRGIQNVQRFRGKISFENVRFAYPQKPGKQIYNGISLVIPEGKTVALVGGSGCGKSTLAQLVCRLYDPVSGQVKVDDTDIRDYNLKWYREQLAVVSQEPRLFSASIYENIRNGNPYATEDEVHEAAKMASAHDFIMTLADKYDTPCGEGGSQLSGGQKQRIAIARAFLRRPSILVLDEATSALDTKSEKMVQQTLGKLVKELKCTTLIIAHRLSTIRDADMIVVFARKSEAGAEIAEIGNHDELLLKGGIYAQLVSHQLINVEEGLAEKESASSEASRTLEPAAAKKIDLAPPEGNVEVSPMQLPNGKGFRRLVRTLEGDQKALFLSITYALANSLTFPIWGAVFGVLGAKFMTAVEKDIVYATRASIIAYAVFTVYGGVLGGVQFRYAAALKEKGRRALRKSLMANLLYKDMSFFDDPLHDAGSLTEAFSVHTSQASQWLGDALSMTVQFGFGIVVACVIALWYNWIAGLITLGLNLISIPLLLHGGAATAATEQRLDASDDDRDPEAPAFIMYETIENILAVKLFTMDDTILLKYQRAVEKDLTEACRSMKTASLLYSELNLIPWLLEFLLIWILGILIRKNYLQFNSVYPALNAIQFVSFGFGSLAAELGDFGKARRSADTIFNLIDAPSSINAMMRPEKISETPSSLAKIDWSRGIEFRAVTFAYPQRSRTPVYRDLSFNIPPGYTVAFVGSSGCGKSTGIQLIERFYDVTDQGRGAGILIGGLDVCDWNLKELRGIMSLVSQEPKLFASSIEENIALGSESVATSDAIKHAADMAEVTNFSNALEDGMQTDVGKRGERLSGGQRQRVAIARALIRRPRILILDEATSALDAESEALVQASIDRLTASDELAETITIVIAHRLSTIKNVDRIYVLDNSDGLGSRLIQCGSFNELIQDKQGEFYKLAQSAH